jgi:hypothetical protein
MGCCCRWLALGFGSVSYATSLSAVSAMSLTESVPERFWGVDKLVDLTFWLNANVSFPQNRKYLLLEWCKLNGLGFTKEMAAGIGLIRG